MRALRLAVLVDQVTAAIVSVPRSCDGRGAELRQQRRDHVHLPRHWRAGDTAALLLITVAATLPDAW